MHHVGYVVCSLMRFAVLAHETCPVYGKHNMKLLKTYVMKYLIVSSLEKCRIYGNHGACALDCHSRCHCDGVLFSYPDVKKARRQLTRKCHEPGSRRHCSRYGAYSVIAARKAHKLATEYFRVIIVRFFLKFARTRVERRYSVELFGIPFGI